MWDGRTAYHAAGLVKFPQLGPDEGSDLTPQETLHLNWDAQVEQAVLERSLGVTTATTTSATRTTVVVRANGAL